jgi:D-serine deaminase-like pyridoxal phosphate-dependent protein
VRKGGFEPLLTGGGSGSLAIDLELDGLDELQPGSFVFMDAAYSSIEWRRGEAPPFRNALSILTSVVSRPDAHRAIVDVGWKSASCDSGMPVPKRHDLTFEFAGDEHGCIQSRDGSPINLQLGDTIELIPSHCDTTVNLYSHFTVVRDGSVQDTWPVLTRGCSR